VEPVIDMIGKLHHTASEAWSDSVRVLQGRTHADGRKPRASLQLADGACTAHSTSNRPAPAWRASRSAVTVTVMVALLFIVTSSSPWAARAVTVMRHDDRHRRGALDLNGSGGGARRPHDRATASPGRRLAWHCAGYVRGLPGARAEGTNMAAEQDKDIGTGRVPGLNTERIYSTTIPADELAQALADHFRAQGFEAQVFRTSGDRTAMQARKESLWRNLLGVAYALTVTFTRRDEGQLSIALGGHEWVDAAVSGAIGLVAVPPVLLGTAYGIWKENQLDKEVWQVIDERVSAPSEAGP
jgi:hypothetical protein